MSRTAEEGGAQVPTQFTRIVARAKAAGLRWSLTGFGVSEGGAEDVLRIELPNGRGTRARYIDHDDVPGFESIAFEDFRVLGDYDAVVRSSTGEIEARLTSLDSNYFPIFNLTRRIQQLPGVERLDGPTLPLFDDDEAVRMPMHSGDSWRVVMSHERCSLEISPISEELAVLLRLGLSGSPTLKVRGGEYRSYDDSLELLERIGHSVMFDLDLRYQLAVGLARRRLGAIQDVRARVQSPPEFPRNRYEPDPLALYLYGRSARGLPLLEFLAYYQTVEYFFPMFSRAEAVTRIRQALLDPRFNASSDLDVNRVIAVAESAAGTHVGERQQLRVALRACVDSGELHAFVEAEPVKEHFCGKKQVIRGTDRLNPASAATDMRDQVADRLYAIRCRVVHTKQEGGESGVDLLLPSSPEARSLGPDVALARFVAQKALIASARPMQLNA